jgi:hypothetical protein
VAEKDLSRWLATLDAAGDAGLSGLLARRPDVHAEGERAPEDLVELARRLTRRTAVFDVLGQLPLPGIEVVEALQALAPPEPPPPNPKVRSLAPPDADAVDRAALAGLLGRTADDPELDATLRMLSQRALAWPSVPDDGRVHLSPPLRWTFDHPLELGRPAAELLMLHGVDTLRRIAARLGRPGLPTKAEMTFDLGRWLAAPGNVTDLVDTAPPETRAVLEQFVADGPVLMVGTEETLPDHVRWAVDRALLVADGWERIEMPREAGLALRGLDWHAPFHPAPPVPELAAVESTVVGREAGAAVTTFLDRLSALVDTCGATPPQSRKAGGVGVREIKRLGKAIGADEAMTRLLLEVAHACEFIAQAVTRFEGVRATAAYDDWAALEPAEQLAAVLPHWLAMRAAPMGGAREPVALAAPDETGALAATLRPIVLRTLAAVEEGHGVTDPAAFSALVRWNAPLPLYGQDGADDVLGGLWRELAAVGVCAYGALTPIGRALVEGEPVAEAAGSLVSAPSSTVRLQGDLTAVVSGTPTGPLRELLDLAADREVRGTASVWRFSPASVRRSLDSGLSSVDVAERLRAVTSDGELPQPLEYLIGDVARRHGVVRVRAVGCVVVSADTALLAEIAAVRALQRLGLTLLAPTVLASAAEPGVTVTALRDAGYAPVSQDAGGAVVVERIGPQRVEPPLIVRKIGRAATSRTVKTSTVDTLALARTLLDAPGPAESARVEVARAVDIVPPMPRERRSTDTGPFDAFTEIARRAPQLSERSVRLLATAVEHGTPVRIDYTDGRGEFSSRVIEEATLDEHLLDAWCRLRDDERAFVLARIDAVYPA